MAKLGSLSNGTYRPGEVERKRDWLVECNGAQSARLSARWKISRVMLVIAAAA